MNLKTSLFGTIAGLALVGSLAAPTVMAQAVDENGSNNTTTATVGIVAGGSFDAYFDSAFNLTGNGLLDTSNTSPTVTGQFTIGYEDTKAFRPQFDISVSATDFVGTVNSSLNTIPATGFTITRSYNTQQTHWNSAFPGTGDIGYFADGHYVSNISGPSTAWTPGLTSLGAGTKVGFGRNGIGTVLTTATYDVALEVPNTTATDTYVSTLTLSIVTGTQP